ncbi:hypothetical protein MUG87_07055 [Ectobacillus sp. JY-23]|uniref:hypothetical protein n=1 Tax=Ectobacillus sp. JY-23 TaxID=2933872 RepID=UPI001FF5E715|nr:hypothetical protein [Ectobacillus sp. JY-23]UOY93863.1 hypothetical protein MUG87_07055 [Ectobacillus sp. JY-23]
MMIRLVLTVAICTWFTIPVAAKELTPPLIIEKEMRYLNTHDYLQYASLWTKAMQNEVLFIHSPKDKNTIFNITEASLVTEQELSFPQAMQYIPRLSKYISHFGAHNVQVRYVEALYKVKQETSLQRNGENCFIQVFAKEHGIWRIAESVSVKKSILDTNASSR